MDHLFRNALILSILIHAGLASPLLLDRAEHRRLRQTDLAVDYVVIAEPTSVETAKESELKPQETPRVEIKPKAEVAPAPKAPAARAEPAKESPSELAKKQAKLQSTEDYINYYQLIRERIRQEVKRRYRRSSEEGEVYLNFILGADGRLSACEADPALSRAGRQLIDMAAASLRSAAPFPPFPKALAVPRVAFSVTIVFKADR